MFQVKWQGKKFQVDVDLAQPGEVFKTQLFSLTGVAPERQKILVKGGQLKDDTDMFKLGLKENQILMMVGTADAIPQAPAQPVKFFEDMSESEVAKTLSIPSGLTNLGNTCYLNATLQCLNAIPQLKGSLSQYKPGAGSRDQKGSLTDALRMTFNLMSKTGNSVAPLLLVQAMRSAFPKYADRDPQSGGYRQQDAEECWNDMLASIDGVLKDTDDDKRSIIEKYLSGTMVTTIKSAEAPDEQPIVREEKFRKLDCHIDKSVNYVHQGIKQSLEQAIEKNSESLGRNAEYTSTSRIARLPEYLTVTYNRFFWKASESVEAKIVKGVKFPLDLDVSEFCTPELQEKMRPARQHLRGLEEKKALERKLAKRPKHERKEEEPVDAQKKAEDKDNDKDVEMAPAGGSSSAAFTLDPEFKLDIGCNPSGMYELIGVITHIGRTANSGHYIGWIRKEKDVGGPDPSGPGMPGTQHWWYKFDDDTVSMVTDDDILKLCGGGDWHTAYVTLYRAKQLE
ncbi:deubiquitinating enzyme [Dipsacomyces acuminosporus]|nr:deubiquitinating enzyme [Dipsacomyces acuminosporus]